MHLTGGSEENTVESLAIEILGLHTRYEHVQLSPPQQDGQLARITDCELEQVRAVPFTHNEGRSHLKKLAHPATNIQPGIVALLWAHVLPVESEAGQLLTHVVFREPKWLAPHDCSNQLVCKVAP